MFDDGFQSAYDNGFPIVNEFGFKASTHLLSDFIGTPEYFDVAAMNVLKGQGHEIGAHTKTHPHLPQISEEDAREEIEGSKSDLEDLGINVETFVYPFGEVNESIKGLVQNAGFKGARGTEEGFNDGNSDRYDLLAFDVQFQTLDSTKELVDQVEQNGKWLILIFHRVGESGEYNVSEEFLHEVLEHVADSGVEVITMGQGLDLLNEIE
jgi:peptidoglycan/xylan/chitin deacetylase (PgdA/CDA1 family)